MPFRNLPSITAPLELPFLFYLAATPPQLTLVVFRGLLNELIIRKFFNEGAWGADAEFDICAAISMDRALKRKWPSDDTLSGTRRRPTLTNTDVSLAPPTWPSQVIYVREEGARAAEMF